MIFLLHFAHFNPSLGTLCLDKMIDSCTARGIKFIQFIISDTRAPLPTCTRIRHSRHPRELTLHKFIEIVPDRVGGAIRLI